MWKLLQPLPCIILLSSNFLSLSFGFGADVIIVVVVVSVVIT